MAEGLIEVMVGVDVWTLKIAAVEARPLTLTAVTEASPDTAIKLADTVAVSFEALTKVVGRADPFHLTVVPVR